MAKKVKTVSPSEELSKINDTQEGPLAEACAIADILNIVATDGSPLRNDSFVTISRMLMHRLDEVSGIITTADRALRQSKGVVNV